MERFVKLALCFLCLFTFACSDGGSSKSGVPSGATDACVTDADCPGAMSCLCGSCSLTCDLNVDCFDLDVSFSCIDEDAPAAEAACGSAGVDGANNLCLLDCVTQRDCTRVSPQLHCVSGACTRRRFPEGCVTSADCPDNAICDENVCVGAGGATPFPTPSPSPTPVSECAAGRRLVNVGNGSISVAPGGRGSVQVVALCGDRPLADTELIIEAVGTLGGAALSTRSGVLSDQGRRVTDETDDTGSVRAEVIAGNESGTFELRVSDPCRVCTPASPLTIPVVIAEGDAGELTVEVDTVDAPGTGSFEALLYRGNFSCSAGGAGTHLDPRSPPPGMFAQSPRQNANAVSRFRDLPAGNDYYLLVLGYSGNGNDLVSSACLSIQIGQNGSSRAEAELQALGIAVSGELTLRSRIDLTPVTPFFPADEFDTVTGFFTGGTPSTWFASRMETALGSSLDGGAVAALNALAAGRLDLDPDVAFGLLGSALSNPGRAYRDLEILSTLDAGAGTHTLDEARFEFTDRGAALARVTFGWTLQNDFSPASARAVPTVDGGRELLLTVPAHELADFSFGKLYTLFVEQVVLPWMTGTLGSFDAVDSLAGLLNYLYRCDDVADRVSAGGLSQRDLEDACLAALDTGGQALDEAMLVLSRVVAPLELCDGGCTATVVPGAGGEIEELHSGTLPVQSAGRRSGGCFTGRRSRDVMSDPRTGELNISRCSLPGE